MAQSKPEIKPLSKNKRQKIDSLMEKASAALASTEYFEAERCASEALTIAHLSHDYECMARILMPLQESRRQIRLAAIDTGEVIVLNDHARLEEVMGEGCVPGAGCYVLEPPLVGANGRNLRDLCKAEGVAAVVVVHEPQTELGRWPVVMIGPITVRTHVAPPTGGEITMEWLLGAGEQHGDSAIESALLPDDPADRVDALMDRLGTIVDHEQLMQTLERECKAASKAVAEAA
jgi:hypothetical protein